MQIPPSHNFINTIDDTYLFLNIFTEGTPYYFCLSHGNDSKNVYSQPCTFEELYRYVQSENNHKYIMPTSATTPEEVRRLHPELFI